MSEQSTNQPPSGNTSIPVKWIVVGIVIIAFMLIFKGELGGLLERTSDIKISATGLEIKAEVKTVETPIGQTEVSVVPIARTPQATTGIKDTTYVNTKYDFQISWPNNQDWTADEELGRQFAQNMGMPATIDIPIVILSNNLIDDFRPNVNVVVENVGQMQIEEYVSLTKQNLLQQGWDVLSTSVDPETNGGVIVLINNMLGAGNELYQFQRYAMGNGNAYIITASQVPQADLSQGLKDDLASIINSFRLIQ